MFFFTDEYALLITDGRWNKAFLFTLTRINTSYSSPCALSVLEFFITLIMILNFYTRVSKSFKLSTLHFRNVNLYHTKTKQSYHFALGDIPLCGTTVGQLVDDAASRSGDQISFISAHQGIAKNYSEFREEVNKLASGLISLGLRKGDKIAIYSPNCYEWPLVQYASAKAGLVLVNINPAFQSSEVEYCLKKVRCKAVISWDQLKNRNSYSMFCDMIPELPNCSLGRIESKNFPHLELVIMIGNNKDYRGTLRFNDVLNAGNAESNKLLGITESSILFDDPVNIQFTSGTTGNPKASLLTHHNIVNNAAVCGRVSNYHIEKSVACCQVPMFHCFGSVFASLSAVIFHHTCVFPSILFNAKESLNAIEKYKCTIVYGTPTMYMDLLHNYKEFKPNVDSLSKAILGGAAAPEALVKDIKNELGLTDVLVAYGSTENSPGVAGTRINGDFELTLKGMLTPYDFLEVKVIDNKGFIVPVNTQGELCVRGHAVFMGYFEDKEKTDEVLDETRWYHTGDLVTMNEDGKIKVVGRIKDMVIRGGENLFPVEIENFLHTHPAILEAQVVGVPDERMGEELCAWISLKKGERLTEDELRHYCKGKISHFKVPRYIMFVEDFPRTESGKIKKFEMKRISKEKLNL